MKRILESAWFGFLKARNFLELFSTPRSPHLSRIIALEIVYRRSESSFPNLSITRFHHFLKIAMKIPSLSSEYLMVKIWLDPHAPRLPKMARRPFLRLARTKNYQKMINKRPTFLGVPAVGGLKFSLAQKSSNKCQLGEVPVWESASLGENFTLGRTIFFKFCRRSKFNSFFSLEWP